MVDFQAIIRIGAQKRSAKAEADINPLLSLCFAGNTSNFITFCLAACFIFAILLSKIYGPVLLWRKLKTRRSKYSGQKCIT